MNSLQNSALVSNKWPKNVKKMARFLGHGAYCPWQKITKKSIDKVVGNLTQLVFGTDFPYDMADGDKFTKKTIDAVYRMNISDADKQRIFEDNARRILQLAK